MAETEIGSAQQDWPENYFNYFTEIEEHFRRARGTGLFLLSPLDWALIENWRAAGVPLEAVFRGIDAAFEKWQARKSKRRSINSLGYCTQAVMEAAQRAPRAEAIPGGGDSPFTADEIARHLREAADIFRSSEDAAVQEIGSSAERLGRRRRGARARSGSPRATPYGARGEGRCRSAIKTKRRIPL